MGGNISISRKLLQMWLDKWTNLNRKLCIELKRTRTQAALASIPWRGCLHKADYRTSPCIERAHISHFQVSTNQKLMMETHGREILQMDKKTTVTNLIRDLASQFIPLKVTAMTKQQSFPRTDRVKVLNKQKEHHKKLIVPYIDCKFLKSPMAGEISPPRFKLDKFLQTQKGIRK